MAFVNGQDGYVGIIANCLDGLSFSRNHETLETKEFTVSLDQAELELVSMRTRWK
jgi:hypothetical protein